MQWTCSEQTRFLYTYIHTHTHSQEICTYLLLDCLQYVLKPVEICLILTKENAFIKSVHHIHSKMVKMTYSKDIMASQVWKEVLWETAQSVLAVF